jgi:hypothetical protein
MAFDAEPTRTPERIGRLMVILESPDPTSSAAPSAQYRVQVWLSDGTDVYRTGNLTPHITVQQRDALLAFMENLRTQAETEMLG